MNIYIECGRKNFKVRQLLENLRIDGTIILKWMLNKWVMIAWNE